MKDLLKNSTKREIMIMLIPCVVLLVLFYYVPLFGWSIAFFDYKVGLGISNSTFVGLKNFQAILQEPELIQVIINTLALNFAELLLSPIPAIFAILITTCHSKMMKRIIQTTTTLPHFISWVLVYSIFFTFLNQDRGIINDLLIKLNIIDKPINFLANPDIVWIIQPLVSLWKQIGWSAIIYMAAIGGIDPTLYDVAGVDGANWWHKTRHVTIPALTSTYVVLLVLSIGRLLSNGFEQYYQFYNPVIHDKIQVLDYYLWRVGFVTNDFSFSTALGVSKTFVSLILLFAANKMVKKIRGSAIF